MCVQDSAASRRFPVTSFSCFFFPVNDRSFNTTSRRERRLVNIVFYPISHVAFNKFSEISLLVAVSTCHTWRLLYLHYITQSGVTRLDGRDAGCSLCNRNVIKTSSVTRCCKRDNNVHVIIRARIFLCSHGTCYVECVTGR